MNNSNYNDYCKFMVSFMATTAIFFMAMNTASAANERRIAAATATPSFAAKAMRRMRPLRCPKGMYPKTNWFVTPPQSLQRDNFDIPSYLAGAPRGLGQSTGVNKWFTQTYYTKEIVKDCCRVKQAQLWIQGSSTPPRNPLIGNDANNDVYAEFQSGAVTNMVSGSSLFPFPNAPGSQWKSRALDVNNVMSDGKFSFAIGDDTNVLRTALYTASCCLDPIPTSPRRHNLRDGKAAQLQKLLKQDNGQAHRRGRPAPATR